MIQLTKGKNVLDINLSDFSGAGQDVVQNGSFTDIGSDLILNGDFAEIGSDLVTNGDFSAAGSNLVSNPNFTDGVEQIVDGDFPLPNVNWLPLYSATINGGSATITGLGSLTSTGTNFSVSQEVTGHAVGKSYKVTFTAKQLTGVGVMYGGIGYVNQFSQVITSEYVTYTFYQTPHSTGGGWENIAFGGILATGAEVTNTFEIKDVSVKELGADWTEEAGDPDSISFGENGLTIVQSTDLGTDNRAYQFNVTSADKSYKVTYTIHSAQYTASNRVQYYDGNSYVNLPEQGIGTHTFYYTREGTNDTWIFNLKTTTASATDFVTISSISVQELGEGWAVQTGWSIGEDKAICDGSTNNAISQALSLPVGNIKVTFKVEDFTSGDLNLWLNLPTFTNPLQADANGDYEVYVTTTSGANNLYFYSVAFIGSVTNITVQEVGQDWTFGDGWGMGENKAISTLESGSKYLTQLVVESGNWYKINYEVIDYTSGSVKATVSGAEGTARTSIGTYTDYLYSTGTTFAIKNQSGLFIGSVSNVIVQQLDTNNRWVTFADPTSKSVMKLGQVDLEIDSSGNNCGVYQTGLIKPNKLYIITINMKATAALNVEIAASLGTTVSAVIGTTALTTSYVEYSFEYVTPFAVAHDLQIHRLLGSGDSETISIDYVSMNGVDESQWINDPTWNPFATSLVYVPTLTDESTNNSKQFTLDTSIADGGWDGRSLHGQVIINESPTEDPANGEINLEQPDFLEGFYQVEIRGYLGTFYRILGKGMAHLERASTEDGYNRFEAYNDSVTYKAYEE
jgi:hypothetical protein